MYVVVAYIIPTRPNSSATQSSHIAPVMVRFSCRELRDNVIRNRRLLKSSKISIVEDLTTLNMEVLNRLRNSELVQKTWTWNGHVQALLKNGQKIQVRPFETVEECLNKH